MLFALALLACGEKDDTGTADTQDTGDTADSGDTAAGCQLTDVWPRTIPADRETEVVVTSWCGDIEAQETVTIQVGYSDNLLARTTPNGVDFTVAIHHHASKLERQHRPLTITKRIAASSAHFLDHQLTALDDKGTEVLVFQSDGSVADSLPIDAADACVTDGLCRPIPGGFAGFDGKTITQTTTGEKLTGAPVIMGSALYGKVGDVQPLDLSITGDAFTALLVAEDTDGTEMFAVIRDDGTYAVAESIAGLTPDAVRDGKGWLALAPLDSDVTGFDNGTVVRAFVIDGGSIVLSDHSVFNLNKSSGESRHDFHGAGEYILVESVSEGGTHSAVLAVGDEHIVVETVDGALTSWTASTDPIHVGGGLVLAGTSHVGDGGSIPLADPWTAPEDIAPVRFGDGQFVTSTQLLRVPQTGDAWVTAVRSDGVTGGWGLPEDGGGANAKEGDKYPDNMQHKEREHISFTYDSVAPTVDTPLATSIDDLSPFNSEGSLVIQARTGSDKIVDAALDKMIPQVAAPTDDGTGWTVAGTQDQAPVLCDVSVHGTGGCTSVEGPAPALVVVGDFDGTGEAFLFIDASGTSLYSKDKQLNRRTELSVLNFDYRPAGSVADVNGDGYDDVVVHDGPEAVLLLSDGDGGWLDQEYTLDLTGLAYPGPVPGHAQEGPLVESSHYWGG